MGSTSKSSQLSSSTNSSLSQNTNKDLINSLFTPTVQTGGMATNGLQALLGLGGDPSAQQAAFSNFRDNTGYQFQLDQGLDAINGKYAGGGLFNSGARGKALMKYGQGMADTSFNNYLMQLSGLASNGLQAGGLLGSVGGMSESQGQSQSSGSSKSKGGLGDAAGGIGGLLSGAAKAGIVASDPRLKKGAKKIGELPDGLGVYEYSYIWDDDNLRHRGVMADEVKKLRPWALGPELSGYMSVDYSKLGSRSNG